MLMVLSHSSHEQLSIYVTCISMAMHAYLADNRLHFIRNEALAVSIAYCKKDHSNIHGLRQQVLKLETHNAELRPCKLLLMMRDAFRIPATPWSKIFNINATNSERTLRT